MKNSTDETYDRFGRESIGLTKQLNIFKRDNYKCVLCGCLDNIDICYKIPPSKGGTEDIDNLISVCLYCIEKGSCE